MPVIVRGTDILFNDGTVQNTAFKFSSTQTFVSNGTFTMPAGLNTAQVVVVGGGGGISEFDGRLGGKGGFRVVELTGLSGSFTVTVGNGGTSITSGTTGATAGTGGTSSFGSLVTATGGTGGIAFTTNGTNGTSSSTSGTVITFGAGAFVQNFPASIRVLRRPTSSSSGFPATPEVNNPGDSIWGGNQSLFSLAHGGMVIVKF